MINFIILWESVREKHFLKKSNKKQNGRLGKIITSVNEASWKTYNTFFHDKTKTKR